MWAHRFKRKKVETNNGRDQNLTPKRFPHMWAHRGRTFGPSVQFQNGALVDSRCTLGPSVQLRNDLRTLWAHSGRIVGALWAHFGPNGSTPKRFLDMMGASWAHSSGAWWVHLGHLGSTPNPDSQTFLFFF